MVTKKYDANFKIQLVKEYLEKKKKKKKANPKLAKADFAFEHKVSDSTFNDWVLKYQKMGDEFANVTNQIELLATNVVEASAIVKYVGEVHLPIPKDMVRVIYKGITVEFNECLAEKIMGIIRTW